MRLRLLYFFAIPHTSTATRGVLPWRVEGGFFALRFAFTTTRRHPLMLLPTRTAGRTPGGRSGRMRRTVFVRRELAIAILVEFLQGFGSVGDFIRVDHPVAIGVEHRFQRRLGMLVAAAGLRRTVRRRGRRCSACILCLRLKRCRGKRQRACDCEFFHNIKFFFGLLPA